MKNIFDKLEWRTLIVALVVIGIMTIAVWMTWGSINTSSQYGHGGGSNRFVLEKCE